MSVESHGSWQSAEYADAWASEDVMAPMLELPRRLTVALLADAGVDVRHVVDLGAGPGAYLKQVLEAFPNARGTWMDASDAMLDLAKAELDPFGDRVRYVVMDVEALEPSAFEAADAVVTSRVLHHFTPDSLGRIYQATAEIVKPGGFVFNLDHVGSPDDTWHGTYRRVREQFFGGRRRQLRPHRQEGPLPPVEIHLDLMTAAGLEYADVPWRLLMTALMMARKPLQAL